MPEPFPPEEDGAGASVSFTKPPLSKEPTRQKRELSQRHPQARRGVNRAGFLSGSLAYQQPAAFDA